MTVRTFLDANVLIAAHHGEETLSNAAMLILEDTKREFIATNYLKLELLPKPVFEKQKYEEEFYEQYFNVCEYIPSSDIFSSNALNLAKKYSLKAIDALHIAAAIIANADEFITLENSTRPMFKVSEVDVKALV